METELPLSGIYSQGDWTGSEEYGIGNPEVPHDHFWIVSEFPMQTGK